MIPFLNMIDGHIVHPKNIDLIKKSKWIQEKRENFNFQLKHKVVERVTNSSWVSGFLEADGYLGAKQPGVTETNTFGMPPFWINFTQKDLYLLHPIMQRYPSIDWGFDRRNRKNGNFEHTLIINQNQLVHFLPILRTMNFQGTLFELCKHFVNGGEFKRNLNPKSSSQKAELFALVESLSDRLCKPVPDEYRYNFSFMPEERTRFSLSLKQMNLILKLKEK